MEHYEKAKTPIIITEQQLFSIQKISEAGSWRWEGNVGSGGSIQGEK